MPNLCPVIEQREVFPVLDKLIITRLAEVLAKDFDNSPLEEFDGLRMPRNLKVVSRAIHDRPNRSGGETNETFKAIRWRIWICAGRVHFIDWDNAPAAVAANKAVWHAGELGINQLVDTSFHAFDWVWQDSVGHGSPSLHNVFEYP